jgi:hypothetical protein
MCQLLPWPLGQVYPYTSHYAALAHAQSDFCRSHGGRWTWRMEEAGVMRDKWRKHGQWFALLRSHAELVAKVGPNATIPTNITRHNNSCEESMY